VTLVTRKPYLSLSTPSYPCGYPHLSILGWALITCRDGSLNLIYILSNGPSPSQRSGFLSLRFSSLIYLMRASVSLFTLLPSLMLMAWLWHVDDYTNKLETSQTEYTHYKMASTIPTETKQPDLWISEFVTFSAATVFIGLRLLSRRLTRIEFWWDDWFAIGCYVCRYTSFIRILANLSGCGYCLGSDHPSLDRRRSRTSHQRDQVQKDQGGDLNAE
jgi:hypothetical protein